jgi:hypothetical protein
MPRASSARTAVRVLTGKAPATVETGTSIARRTTICK